MFKSLAEILYWWKGFKFPFSIGYSRALSLWATAYKPRTSDWLNKWLTKRVTDWTRTTIEEWTTRVQTNRWSHRATNETLRATDVSRTSALPQSAVTLTRQYSNVKVELLIIVILSYARSLSPFFSPRKRLIIPVPHWLKFYESVLDSTENCIWLAGSRRSPSSPRCLLLTMNTETSLLCGRTKERTWETNEREVKRGIMSVRERRVVPLNCFSRKRPITKGHMLQGSVDGVCRWGHRGKIIN